MRQFILALAMLCGAISAHAQIPTACSTESVQEPNSSLNNCLIELQQSSATLEKAIIVAYSGLEIQGDSDKVEVARQAGRIVASDFSELRDQFCETPGEEDTCSLMTELTERAITIAAFDQTDTNGVGWVNFDLGRVRANVYRFGELNRREEIVLFCGFVEANDWRNTRECSLAATNCDEGCQARLDLALDLLPKLSVLREAALVIDAEILNEIIREENRRVAAWESYLVGGEGADAQHIGELYLNEWVFLDNDDTVNTRSSMPPSQRLVFLRPGVGLEVFEADGTKVELAGIVELIGYRSWGWDEKGARRSAWGVSAIAAYSPEDDADDWGYGILVKTPFNNIDVSWTARDSVDGTRHAVMFSTDLTGLLPSSSKSAACRLIGESTDCLE